jgi:hypothetical protein
VAVSLLLLIRYVKRKNTSALEYSQGWCSCAEVVYREIWVLDQSRTFFWLLLLDLAL